MNEWLQDNEYPDRGARRRGRRRPVGLDPDRIRNAAIWQTSTSIPGGAQRNGATTYYIEYSAIPLANSERATGFCTDPCAWFR